VWTQQFSSAELLAKLQAGGVPSGLVYEPADMMADPHFQARQSLVEVPDDDHGSIVMPAVAPRLSETPGRVRWRGPLLGQHTDDVLAAAGLHAADIAKLHETGVI
jgi:crotonobetainyl-CoA:carnitine CoA-transferase CaiB-like acyl-CoA transferase